ncbi:hypothetical protein PCANC_25747 [Puccinia coronata f. sp. avenae]|uniref:PIK-related kinase FAT domain-containing protein n=1 Tax=Puccinia coronata f. sp. avenae TaxID=200324 RepID=A0A2N5RXV3_9BASI|nr:hypothetical protein PCANC_25747 [Puccinia coronata f. sp. avenae]
MFMDQKQRPDLIVPDWAEFSKSQPTDGVRTFLDAVTAYQRQTARAKRTTSRNQPGDSRHSKPAKLGFASCSPESNNRSRPHPPSRKTKDLQSDRKRQHSDSQPVQKEQLDQLFDPKLNSSYLPSKRSADKNRGETRLQTASLGNQSTNGGAKACVWRLMRRCPMSKLVNGKRRNKYMRWRQKKLEPICCRSVRANIIFGNIIGSFVRQKCNKWERLSDLARAEHNSELLLECQWRQADWSAKHESIKLAIANLPSQSIRKTTFQAYLTLLNGHIGLLVDEHRSEFTKICDKGIQLCLHQWFRLPEIVTDSHIPLLQVFRQFVELQEASQIFHSLTTTTSQNLEARSVDLKHVLQTWRERLPNPWDVINIWTRKHGLLQLCKDSLTRIYTLPNIEISEAFLKLCEQAKVHFEHSEDFGSGFEAISQTNLMYFGALQKAKFHTIKAVFLARLNLHKEALQVFNQAVSTDLQYPKAWAQWGAYQDKLFENSPENLQLASGAVNCYLQASGMYKNGKSRKLLIRIFWLIGLVDANGMIGRAFNNYK